MKDETEIRRDIEGLRHLTTAQLKDRYREVFGEDSRSNHKQFLFRRIAWRIQANAWGGLSERARRRALEIADDADLRIRAPKNFLARAHRRRPDDRGEGQTVARSATRRESNYWSCRRASSAARRKMPRGDFIRTASSSSGTCVRSPVRPSARSASAWAR